VLGATKAPELREIWRDGQTTFDEMRFREKGSAEISGLHVVMFTVAADANQAVLVKFRHFVIITKQTVWMRTAPAKQVT